MLRNLIIAWLLTLAGASHAFAQNWAEKMFEVTNHDFGTVARGETYQRIYWQRVG